MSTLTHSDYHLLVVEQTPEAESALLTLLTTIGYRLTCMPSMVAAAGFLRREHVDVALIHMTPNDTIEQGLLVMTRSFFKDLPVVIYTETITKKMCEEYIRLGVIKLLEKPVDPRALLACIESILRAQNTDEQPQPTEPAAALLAQSQATADREPKSAQAPIWQGSSVHAKQLNTAFARLNQFNALALLEGPLGLGALDMALELERPENCLLVSCLAEWLDQSVLMELLAPAQGNDRPVLLVILASENLDTPKQALVESLFNQQPGGVLSEQFAGRVRVLLCGADSLCARAEQGHFSERLLMRAGIMTQQVRPLTERREDLWLMALAIWSRTGCAQAQVHSTSKAWVVAQAWPGDYAQFHRTIELAGQLALQTQSMVTPRELAQAAKLETTWDKPLYHEKLMTQYAGPLVVWD